MNRTFHLRKYYRNVGLECFAVSTACCVGSVSYAIATAAPGRRIHEILICLGSFGFFVCLSIYILAGYCRSLLSVNGTIVRSRGIVRVKELDLRDVTEAKWRLGPVGGSIVLMAATTKLKLFFHGFSIADRRDIVMHLREHVPAEVQHNWPLFCDQIALPLRESQKLTQPDEIVVVVTRRRWDWYFVPIVAGMTAIAGFLWWRLNRPAVMLLPLFPVAM